MNPYTLLLYSGGTPTCALTLARLWPHHNGAAPLNQKRRRFFMFSLTFTATYRVATQDEGLKLNSHPFHE